MNSSYAYFYAKQSIGLSLALVALISANAIATELNPFQATYDVYLNGKRRGESTLVLARDDGHGWHYSVLAKANHGLAKLAGFAAEQTTTFEMVNGHPRPVLEQVRTEALLSSRRTEIHFDWMRSEARWTGDVKRGREGPVALDAHSVNGALLNLVLALESAKHAAGSDLRYTVVERGQSELVHYRIGEREPVETPFGIRRAVPIIQEKPGKEQRTIVWYATGLPPTPLRLLRTLHGKPVVEMRLRTLLPLSTAPPKQ